MRTAVCGLCGAPDARLYPSGPACPNCTPAARSGRSEPGATASDYTPQACPLPIPSGRRARLIAIEVTTLQLPEPDHG